VVARVVSGTANTLDAPALSEGLRMLICTMMSLVCIFFRLMLLCVCFCVCEICDMWMNVD
jgi:hypothetical protein